MSDKTEQVEKLARAMSHTAKLAIASKMYYQSAGKEKIQAKVEVYKRMHLLCALLSDIREYNKFTRVEESVVEFLMYGLHGHLVCVQVDCNNLLEYLKDCILQNTFK